MEASEVTEPIAFYVKDPELEKGTHLLLMLPHSTIWESINVLAIIFNIYVVAIMFTYGDTYNRDIQYYVIDYGLEFLYSVYIIFTIIHRNASIHSKDYCTNRMPFIHLIIGIITLIPFYELYSFLLNVTINDYIRDILKLRAVLRLFHVYVYFARKRKDCSVNRSWTIFIETFAIHALYVCFMSCLVGWLGCYGCEFSNWTTHQKDFMYDHKNFYQRLIYPMVFVGSLVMGNYSGMLIPETLPEISVVLLSMVVGFSIKVNFMMAQYISEYVITHWRHTMFKMRLRTISDFIEFENLSKDTKLDILEYYNVLWIKRIGIVQWNQNYFNLMPDSLKTEIRLDLAWDALSHSQLFRGASLPMKMSIANLMTENFKVKGDVIYDTSDLRDRLIYIVSGVVHLLSDEDDESPILSFTSGTVISEFSCLLPVRSEAKLVCASYCEFCILRLVDFFHGMSHYRNQIGAMQEVLRDRIAFAKTMRKMGKMQPLQISHIKQHWKRIMNEKADDFNGHTSKYLDLIALGGELDLKVEVTCLTSEFPLIMYPYSSFREFTEYIVLIACVIESMIIPYCAAFPRKISPGMNTFLLFLDIIYVLDIYMQLTTAVEVKKTMVVKLIKIVFYRSKQLSFLVDVAASIPFDYFQLLTGCTERQFILWKLPRILKIYKLLKFVRKFENSMVNVNGAFILLLKYNLLWILAVYFFTCLLYITSCYTDDCVLFSWFPTNVELAELNTTAIEPILISLLCTVDVFSSGKVNFYFYNLVDSVLGIIMVIVCFYLIPAAIAEIAATQYWKLQQVANNMSFISSVIYYLNMQNMAPELIDLVRSCLIHRWTHNLGLFELSASEFLRELPEKLEDRVREELIGTWLDKLTLFHTLEEPIRKQILHMAELISYPENSKILYANDFVWNLYIIKRGVCEITSHVPGDVERQTDKWIYNPGDSFPAVEVMHEVPCFLNVVALTAVDTIIIPYTKLIKALKYDETFYKILGSTLDLHLTDHRQTLYRLPTHIIMDEGRPRPLKTVDYFKYVVDDNYDTEETKKKSIYEKTINPSSKLYITYEVIHCLLVIFQFMILVMKLNLLYEYRYTIDTLNFICDIRCWIDILIRMRVQYYRGDGILITHHKSTRKYYMRHSFAMDLYASSPVALFAMDAMKDHFNTREASHLLHLLTRPVQLYRVFMGVDYLCNSIKTFAQASIMRMQCFMFIAVIILLGANFLQLCACTIEDETFSCSMNGWRGGDIVEINTKTALVHYAYLTTLYVHGAPKNEYNEPSNFIYGIYIFSSAISVSLAWFLLSTLISLGLHGKFLNPKMQNDRRNFMLFAKSEGIGGTLISRVLEVNSFLNRYLKSYALSEAEKRLPPQLFRDVAFALNEGILANNDLFWDASKPVQKDMTSKFTKIYYMKDDIIIRNNDINENIYVIKAGRVDISVANKQIISLTAGAMFGCLSNKKKYRQTITAVAFMHSEILFVKASQFNRYIFHNIKIRKRFTNYMLTGREYVQAHDTEATIIDRDLFDISQSKETKGGYFGFFVNIRKTYKAMEKMLPIFYHILYMHISAFSIIFTFIYHLISMNNEITLEFYIILYILDALYWCNLFMSFFLPYVDEVSGLLVIKPRVIARRYVKTYFFLDLSTVLPLEAMFGFLMPSRFFAALLTSNRLIRIVYIFLHYKSLRKQVKLTHFFRWMFIFYLECIFIQFFTNVWHYVACHLKTCRYRRFASHDPEEYIEMLSETYGFMYSYTHVVNYFTGNGLKTTKPLNLFEIVTTLTLVVSSIFMTAHMIGSYALVQIVDNFNLTTYRNCLNDVRKHLNDVHISPVICNKVVKYYDSLWKNQRGEQWPSLIWETRRYLHEDLMMDLYNESFSNHIIFHDTHIDFIRQLLPFVKRCVYYQSMVIVERELINGTMYIIQSGRVQIVDERADGKRHKVTTLMSGQGFGEEQGLANTPHKYTYICETKTVLLSLCVKDWIFLCEFFPASIATIDLHRTD